MSDFEFIIPLKRDDLLVSTEDQYTVAEVFPPDLVVEKLEECALALINDGSPFILNNFDTLFSALVHFMELDWHDVHSMYDKIILKNMTTVHKYLEETLEELAAAGTGADADLRIQALNVLKMTVYVFSQFFQCYNNKLLQKAETCVTVKMKGRKKKNKNEEHAEEHSWDWEEKQRNGLVKLCSVLQLPLVNLWEPPVVEETFTNTAAECCYRALEQASINLVKGKPIKDIVIHVLGVLIKQYSHGLSFVVKSIQLMKRFEHVASPLAEAVTKFVNHLGCKSLIKHLLEEIIEASAELLTSTSDHHVAKSFSVFLTEIAESNPSDIEPVLDSLYPFLDSELSSLRILGLSVMTEVLLGCLSSDELSEEAEVKRKRCLELLEEHILDVNAFVRAKDLQLWQKIVSHGALPKDWIIPLMEDVIAVMMDNSSIVTKQAVHLVKLMMESNPFAAKLGLEELVKTLEEEKGLYSEMKKKEKDNLLPNEGGEEHIWNEVEPELKRYLEDYFKEGADAVVSNEAHSFVPASPEKMVEPRLNKYITERNFAEALKLLVYAESTLSGFKDLRKGIEMSNIDFYMQLFKTIFLQKQSALPIQQTGGTPIKQPPTPVKRTLNRSINNLEDDDEAGRGAPSALAAQKARVIFFTDCVEFVKRLSKAVDGVIKLLASKQVFEVVEAVEFVKLSKQFGVSGAEAGVIEMMKLIHCPEENIRSVATKALEVLYLQPDKQLNTPTAIAKEVVKNLCSLVKDTKLSQKELLETMINEWVKTSALNAYCIVAMLSTFTMEEPGTTPEDSVSALTLLACVVRCQPRLANDNLDTFIQKGLARGRRKSKLKDMRIVCSVCYILQFATSDHPSKRFPNSHEMFTELMGIIEESFLDFKENNYLYMMENALNLIYKLAMKPEAMCQSVLKIAFAKTIGPKRQEKSFIDEIKQEKSISDDTSSVSLSTCATEVESANLSGVSLLNNEKASYKVHEEALARFIYILGHVALRLCIYLEQDVLEEQKKRMKAKQGDNRSAGANKQAAGDEEDELNMAVDVVAANDDALAEDIRKICEESILFGDGLLANFRKLPAYILQNEGRYSLRTKSVTSVALGKFMLVSSKFCSQNIQLFVTILEKMEDVVVKNNLIILFGELLFRFPNVIEPWISYLYLRLRDTCRDVRLNTLLIISHLVTNEMVKVKAQISDVALCIVDDDNEIKDAACRLFQELSTKSNTLYNVMPDIISTLSNPNAETPLPEEKFKKILRFLIDLIQKEKQMENLVEKLCLRLRESESERQWSDLAFCLSLFSYSDRSIRKLIDNVTCFGDKLHCQAVYSCLSGIISSASKSTKPGLKEAAGELSAIIEEALDKGIDGLDRTPGNSNVPKTRPTTRRAARGRSCRKKMNYSDSDSDSNRGVTKARTKRTVKKSAKYNSDSSDSDEEVEKGPRNRTVKKTLKYTDSESGEGEEEVFLPSTSHATGRSCRKKLGS